MNPISINASNDPERDQSNSAAVTPAASSSEPVQHRTVHPCTACKADERARVRRIINSAPVPMCPDAASDSWDSGWDAALEWAFAALDEGAKDA